MHEFVPFFTHTLIKIISQLLSDTIFNIFLHFFTRSTEYGFLILPEF
jgi:hypothetical protein